MTAPAPVDCCACGKPFGIYGRIWFIADGVERRWRCRECADLELHALQQDQFDDWHEAEIAKRRAAGWHR